MAYSVDLPFPPSTNNLFITVGRNRISSPRARAYAIAVRQATKEVRGDCAASGALSGPVRVVIAAWFPDKRKRDLDNLTKAPLDGLVKAGVLADDSQIVDLRIYRAGFDKTNPRITIWITPHD